MNLKQVFPRYVDYNPLNRHKVYRNTVKLPDRVVTYRGLKQTSHHPNVTQREWLRGRELISLFQWRILPYLDSRFTLLKKDQLFVMGRDWVKVKTAKGTWITFNRPHTLFNPHLYGTYSGEEEPTYLITPIEVNLNTVVTPNSLQLVYLKLNTTPQKNAKSIINQVEENLPFFDGLYDFFKAKIELNHYEPLSEGDYFKFNLLIILIHVYTYLARARQYVQNTFSKALTRYKRFKDSDGG